MNLLPKSENLEATQTTTLCFDTFLSSNKQAVNYFVLSKINKKQVAKD